MALIRLRASWVTESPTARLPRRNNHTRQEGHFSADCWLSRFCRNFPHKSLLSLLLSFLDRGHSHTLPCQDENDDYCTSCGGSGELVCCDGCTRSFHLICVDPPLIEDSMPNEWFCNVCRSENQDPAALPVYKGAFRFLLEQADKKNSSAYSLPKHTRERFEGVRTGADGEYEEIVPPAPKPSR